jgi:hypothetical protein
MIEKNYNPDITDQVHEVTGENRKTIILVWNSAMQFVANTIASGEFLPVQIPHLGKFAPNYRKIRQMEISRRMPKSTGYVKIAR